MKLYERINATNWTKGEPSQWRNGQMCLVAHMAILYPHTKYEVERLLCEAIVVLFPGRADGALRPFAYLFNDHPDTTLEDLLHACKVADV